MENKNNNLPFWNEYPERDTEFVRVYPTKYGEISYGDIWKDTYSVMSIQLFPNDKNINFEKYFEKLKDELTMYASEPYIEDLCIRSIKIYGTINDHCNIKYLCELVNILKENFNFYNDVEISAEVISDITRKEYLDELYEIGITNLSITIDNEASDLVNVLKQLDFKSISLNCLKGTLTLTNSFTDTFKCPKVQNVILSNEFKNSFLDIKNSLSSLGFSQIHLIDDKYIFSKDKDLNKYYECSIVNNTNNIAIGIGANGYINAVMYKNVDEADRYMKYVSSKELPIDKGVRIAQKDEFKLYMINNLRFGKAVKSNFIKLFGIDCKYIFGEKIEELDKKGLISENEEVIELDRSKGILNIESIEKVIFS